MLPTRILLLSAWCLTIESFTPALRHSTKVPPSKLVRSTHHSPANVDTILRFTRQRSTTSKHPDLFLLTASTVSSSTSSSELPDNAEKDSYHDNNGVVIHELSSHPSPRCNGDDDSFPFHPQKSAHVVKKSTSSSPKSSPPLLLFLLLATLTNPPPPMTFFSPSAANAIQPKNEALCNTGFFTNVGAWYCTDIGNIGDEGRSKPLSGGEEERLDGLLGKFNFDSGSGYADDIGDVGGDGGGGGNDGDGRDDGGNGSDGVK